MKLTRLHLLKRSRQALRQVLPASRRYRQGHSPRRAVLRGALSLLGLVLVTAFLAGGLSKVRVETGLDSFLPSNDPAVHQFNDVASSFGGDPVVVLLETRQPRKLLDGQHVMSLVQLEGRLSKLPDVAAVYGPGTTLNQVAGQAQSFLAELSGRRDGEVALAQAKAKEAGASDAEAQAAADRARASFDQRYGPLLVQGLPAGLPTLYNPSFVNSVVYGDGKQPRAQWHFVAPSANSVAILVRPRQGMDATSTQKLVDTVRGAVSAARLDADRTTVSGVPTVAAGLSDQVTNEVPRLGAIAIAAVAACFLLVPWTRWRRRLIPLASTIVAIGLTLAVFGWLGRPLSLGVVAFLSVLLGVGSYYPSYFTQNAQRRVVLVAGCATALSFSTLTLSPLPFVRDLGMTLSLGVGMSLLVGWLVATKVVTPPSPDGYAVRDGSDVPKAKSARPTQGKALRAIAALAALLALCGWVSLPALPLQTSFQTFASGLPALDDAKHVEDVVGSSGETDVTLRGNDVLTPEALEWMREAQQVIITRHGDAMRPVLSPPSLMSFLGNAATQNQIDAAMRLLPPYLTGSVIRDDRRVAVMSFGVRMDDLSSLRALRDDVTAHLPKPPPGFHVELTGLPMVAVQGQEIVSQGRVYSNLLGIVAAGAVLALGLRRRRDALRAVAAAILATGLGLFALWGLAVPLTPITVALGSLTAAVGCEFTVLLSEAIQRGDRVLRRSVRLAAATSAIGYLVLVASQLQAIRQFGLLLAGSVVLALLCATCVVSLTAGREPGTSSEDTSSQDPKKSLVGAQS